MISQSLLMIWLVKPQIEVGDRAGGRIFVVRI